MLNQVWDSTILKKRRVESRDTPDFVFSGYLAGRISGFKFWPNPDIQYGRILYPAGYAPNAVDIALQL